MPITEVIKLNPVHRTRKHLLRQIFSQKGLRSAASLDTFQRAMPAIEFRHAGMVHKARPYFLETNRVNVHSAVMVCAGHGFAALTDFHTRPA